MPRTAHFNTRTALALQARSIAWHMLSRLQGAELRGVNASDAGQCCREQSS